jgi:hypothetical protein
LEYGKYVLLYEIDPSLNPEFPETIDACDSNNGVSSDYTRLVINMGQLTKSMYSRSVELNLPRMIWVKKDLTCRQLHVEIFSFLRPIIAEWIHSVYPTQKKQQQINFPYSAVPMTKQEFMEMPLQKAYEMCFRGMEDDCDDDSFDLSKMPYKVKFKNVSSYWEECTHCGVNRCSGCPVPLNDVKIQELLSRLDLTANDTFFSKKCGKELIVQVTWHQDINKQLFGYLTHASPWPCQSKEAEQSQDVKLSDCLQEFK